MHPTRSTSIHKRTLTDIKRKMDSNTVIVGDFNTPLTPMDRSSKQKVNKDTSHKWYIGWDGSHWYLQDIPSKCRTHLLLKCTWTFSRIDHIVGHKSNLSKFKKTETVSSFFSDHNAMRLDINYKKETVRNTNKHITK